MGTAAGAKAGRGEQTHVFQKWLVLGWGWSPWVGLEPVGAAHAWGAFENEDVGGGLFINGQAKGFVSDNPIYMLAPASWWRRERIGKQN